jgi:hypothetical protein
LISSTTQLDLIHTRLDLIQVLILDTHASDAKYADIQCGTYGTLTCEQKGKQNCKRKYFCDSYILNLQLPTSYNAFQQGIIKKQEITKNILKNCHRTLGIFAVALIPKPFHSVLNTSMGAFSLFWNLNTPKTIIINLTPVSGNLL